MMFVFAFLLEPMAMVIHIQVVWIELTDIKVVSYLLEHLAVQIFQRIKAEQVPIHWSLHLSCGSNLPPGISESAWALYFSEDEQICCSLSLLWPSLFLTFLPPYQENGLRSGCMDRRVWVWCVADGAVEQTHCRRWRERVQS